MTPETQTAMDMFDEFIKDSPDEGPAFEDLPVGAWVIGKTSRSEEHGKAGPKVRSFTSGKGVKYHQFSTALISVGGDKKLDPIKHANKYTFIEIFLHPGEKELEQAATADRTAIVSGQMQGFMNAVLACGVEDPAERRAITAGKLREVAADDPEMDGDAVTLEAFGGDRARYMAALFVLELEKESRTVLFKTKKGGYKKEGEWIDKPPEAGTIEENSEENATKRGVTYFSTGDEDVDGGDGW